MADPDFGYSILRDFQTPLLAHEADERLITSVLDAARGAGLLKARGRQRIDSTPVLAAVRDWNRIELLAKTLRPAERHRRRSGRLAASRPRDGLAQALRSSRGEGAPAVRQAQEGRLPGSGWGGRLSALGRD